MKIGPSRSVDQLTMILEALATIRPLGMGAMAPQLAEHARSLPMGATLVVVASLMPPDLADTISTLLMRGHGIVILNAGDEEFEGLPTEVPLHNVGRYLEGLEFAGDIRQR